MNLLQGPKHWSITTRLVLIAAVPSAIMFVAISAVLYFASIHEVREEVQDRVVAAVKEVAGSLANTPAVCRQSYIHPAVIDTYLQGETLSTLWEQTTNKLKEQPGGLTPDEKAVLALLRKTAENSQ